MHVYKKNIYIYISSSIILTNAQVVAVGSCTYSGHIKQEVPFLEEILGQSFYPHV